VITEIDYFRMNARTVPEAGSLRAQLRWVLGRESKGICQP